ncbi:MAG: DUF1294 domain-containing protein, partial [Sandarakinorhabdus sp.]|nr:DUF1294 domain-containing protein [Sandarakinorhabdus sp.]
MIPSSIEPWLTPTTIFFGMAAAWLIGINVTAYRAFAEDKARAVAGWRRIPEHHLLNLASMGGSIGALLAQRRLRHKTRKEPFAGQLRRIAITQALILLGIAAAILLLAAPASASGFACINPSHHDGGAIHCAGADRSDRMFGIDAPEMPGACRPGRRCTSGDPFAARDHLAALTAGHSITCEQADTDHYGRRVVRCAADGADLSCAMVADGFAVERYGRLNGGTRAATPPRQVRIRPDDLPAAELSAAGEAPQRRIYPGDLVDDSPPPPRPAPERTKLPYVPPEVRSTGPARALFAAWLVIANVAAYGAFA